MDKCPTDGVYELNGTPFKAVAGEPLPPGAVMREITGDAAAAIDGASVAGSPVAEAPNDPGAEVTITESTQVDATNFELPTDAPVVDPTAAPVIPVDPPVVDDGASDAAVKTVKSRGKAD